jgi:putative membrane protein
VLARPWGPSPLRDQQLGGDLLWCIGEAVDVPFLVLLVVQWVRSDARDAARVDAGLDAMEFDAMERDAMERDAMELDAMERDGADPARDGDGAPTDTMRPWWENDASVFGARAAQFQRRPDP